MARGIGGHFQDAPEKPPADWCCCPWLPPPACGGGLGAPPDDSLRLIVPLDGGLLGAAGATFSGVGDASDGDGASSCCCCCFGGSFFPWVLKLPATICTGEAAVRSPATLPPRTRPSGPASETLSPPVRLRWPPFSDRRNDPDRDSISNRPSYVTVPPEVADCRSVTFDMAPFAERMQTARVPC